MNGCCSHCHARVDGFLGDIGRLFWALVATVAGMWLILAMEMLRRSRPQWEHEQHANEELSAMIANGHGADRPT
ncbi:hypothetical protein [Neorhizobium galegae]|uniref:hypothetical protein n=1 Tax=Neorhizobium galegae TaxID=399 RepID=UPI0006228133|nr:hypothetical protein [Neorhizobium galegae]KAB1126617.1 hypothetical protein F4V90_05830 [Neorhizobium galegae]MCQ1808272.1 hypothetical protein [Neorhizobium galegae]CDZ60978.1 Hypothetical protein NGAL_HAMBI2566_42790 [Neorhizobium galegae bv. orientalis]